MRDFSLFDKALKLNWVKRLCSNSDSPWQYIPKSLLADVGGTELFKCNYDYNLLDLDNHLRPFYREIIFYWQDIATAHLKTKWGSLTVNKKTVFFPHWHQAGIKQISDLFDSCEGQFLSFNSFRNKFNVKCDFFQYYSILSSIPQNWRKNYCKKIPKTQLRLPPQPVPSHAKQYTVSFLTSKIYRHQRLRKNF